ncbi:hypothetical protein, partial [Leptospira borgpetersenii]|uniref:hypothetical protein n=1 Tax=Leptospira borgpetersenii TaxID=174 RepID=UPI001F1E41BF
IQFFDRRPTKECPYQKTVLQTIQAEQFTEKNERKQNNLMRIRSKKKYRNYAYNKMIKYESSI